MEKNKSKGADELHEPLIDEYTRLFIGPHRLPVQPYESWWVDGKLMGKSLLKVKRDYRKAGIVKARGYAEPEDHVAFELKENGAVEEFLNSLMKELPPLASIDEIDAIGVDMHPRYSTKRYGKKLSEEFSIELIEVQHHWAHAASLMLDAGVDDVVALTLDGTGRGMEQRETLGEEKSCILSIRDLKEWGLWRKYR